MSRPNSIYLDYAATTPVDLRVLAAMTPYFSDVYGNPSSLHTAGQNAKRAIDQARRTIATLIGCQASELIFTSGGTESDNLALFGMAEAYSTLVRGASSHPTPAHFISSAIEHEAVLEPLKHLKKYGFDVTLIPVTPEGIIQLDALRNALRPDTTLVSIMLANNEIGTLQPIAEVAATLKAYKKQLGRGPSDPPFFHTDACQAAGTLKLNVERLGVDLLTLNGSKIYGPKGIGLLYVRRGVKIAPQLMGGGQEGGRRSGTENVPAIIGLAEALELVQANSAEREAENKRLATLRDRLWDGIQNNLPDVLRNGHPIECLPHHLNITIKGVEGEILLLRLDQEGIFASAGSACTAGNAAPSHVLLALGCSKQDAYSAVRFSLGKFTTEQDIDRTLKVLTHVVQEIRQDSGRY